MAQELEKGRLAEPRQDLLLGSPHDSAGSGVSIIQAAQVQYSVGNVSQRFLTRIQGPPFRHPCCHRQVYDNFPTPFPQGKCQDIRGVVDSQKLMVEAPHGPVTNQGDRQFSLGAAPHLQGVQGGCTHRRDPDPNCPGPN